MEETESDKQAELLDYFRSRVKLEAKLVGLGKEFPKREGFDGYHWEVTLTFSGRSLTTLFSMGTGHSYEAEVKRNSRDAFVARSIHEDTLDRYAAAPELTDVLCSLQSDAQVPLEFEHFCSEFGYDTDSRKAERTHQACLKSRLELQELFGTGSLYDDFLACNFDV